ncbi:hypothetical protein RB653_006537 [Dictyostelium firmibasis]|uniref:Uncharacterized protein n=1 Tax=Dictyostelium firmibasis TaxID=79012 RepID=A0AAN7U330_9MYCE
MYWKIKEKCDYNHMVWRNGKGKSTQIHIEPNGSTLNDPFIYRISRAVVCTAGPFSTFDGYNRSLLILKGNRLSLFHRQKPSESIDLDYFKPYNFNGGYETDSVFIPNTNNGIDEKNNNQQILTVANHFIDSNCSVSPNSPIYTQQPLIPTSQSNEIEETYDFSVISKDSEINHKVEVLSFDDDDNDEDIDDQENHQISKIIDLNPSNFVNDSTLIFYSYNSELTFEYIGIENSRLKVSLLSDQTLIIKELSFDQFNPQHTKISITHTKRPIKSEPSKLIYVKIEPKSI